MTQPKATIINPYNFVFIKHKLYDVIQDQDNNNNIQFKCLCKDAKGENLPMVMTSNHGCRCEKNKCKLVITSNVVKNYFENDVFKTNTVRIPLCKKCEGCVFDCYNIEKYKNSHLKPRFTCTCSEQMKITPSVYGVEHLSEYFQFPGEEITTGKPSGILKTLEYCD